MINGYAAKSKGSLLEKWSYKPRELRENDIDILIQYSGICASDIHTIDSGWSETSYPMITGHEIVGKVHRVGNQVRRHKVGDIVGLGPQCDACLKCEFCINGKKHLCYEKTETYNDNYKDDIGGITYGGYADHIIANEHFVVKIPPGISPAEAAPMLCAGITTYAPLIKLNVGKGSKVGVVGIGGLGHIAIQWASKMGAEVCTFSTSTNKKEEAEKFGSSRFVLVDSLAEEDLRLDVIICTSASEKLDWNAHIKQLKKGGYFVFLGLPEYQPKFDINLIAEYEYNLVGSYIGSPELIEEMLKKAVEYKIKPKIEIMKMDQVNEGIKKVRQNKARYRIVLQN